MNVTGVLDAGRRSRQPGVLGVYACTIGPGLVCTIDEQS
jgi:hypothetical protein